MKIRKTLIIFPALLILLIFTITNVFSETIYIVEPQERGARYHAIHRDGDIIAKPFCPRGMTPRVFVYPAVAVGGWGTDAFPIIAFSTFAHDHGAFWTVRGLVKNSQGAIVPMSRIVVEARCCVIGTRCE
ncbi:MAG: hypothetical protein DDT19_01037 [Syntrophomonadaceae bacterium]|nr:hypothetical protein [Bacillota bacterium]